MIVSACECVCVCENICVYTMKMDRQQKLVNQTIFYLPGIKYLVTCKYVCLNFLLKNKSLDVKHTANINDFPCAINSFFFIYSFSFPCLPTFTLILLFQPVIS